MMPLWHRWDLSPKEAIALQKQLATQVSLQDDLVHLRTIAGADMSIDPSGETGVAGVIVFEYPTLKEIRRVWARGVLPFPYVPGLLSFREGPILLKAFEKLPELPDLIFFDGQGVAHPRRLGIASHMGLLLDRPSIGCGKSLLCGEYREPGQMKGDVVSLTDKGERVGTILRTRDKVKPIFVSPGHKVSQSTAVSLTLECSDGYRIPLPTRLADQYVKIAKQY